MTLFAVLPNDIDDPATPSGGNRYDRELCTGLADLGWKVRELPAAGAWPAPAPAERTALDQLLSALPEGSSVLVDGLIASCTPTVLEAHAHRLRLIVLVHMPFGDVDQAARPAELRALRSAAAIITTSPWSSRRLTDLYGLASVSVTPGVAPAPPAPGSGAAGAFLCVAVVGPHKGHDVLVEALGQLTDTTWTCTLVGALDRDRAFVNALTTRISALGLTDRIRLAGPKTPADLDAYYESTDLLIHPSRGETYGMVAVEALARGIPVLATTAKGLPDAIGVAAPPGWLVPPDDPDALAEALHRWLTNAALRQRLRAAARTRRATLTDWNVTAREVSAVLAARN
ncbi:glycosyltransferase family 4 protein [Dactylosporangium sp. NPDC051541]|uniref:glycosyltransferase family 4 protein n=1 Tax=Dactylosporangium sp. NPDC051541 TaxID=3363977 RepID=UPI0037B8AB2D